MSGKAEVTGHGQNDAVAPYISVFPLFKKVLNPRSAPKGARGSKSVDTFRLHNVLLDEARHDGKEAYVVAVPLGSEHRCIEERPQREDRRTDLLTRACFYRLLSLQSLQVSPTKVCCSAG